jgi:glycyl-tRNA synthetase beta chain
LPTVLLEIGCEELPASACEEALRQMRVSWLPVFGGNVFATPRRLVLLSDEVPDREEDEWVQGPPERLRDKAAEGFARKQGVSVEDLEVREGHLGVVVPGRPLLEALPGRLHELVRGLAFSKSMRWDGEGLRFPRPVRWLCAKLDGQTVEGFRGSTYGHRFAGGEIELAHARDYPERLRATGVEPDQDRRRDQIASGLGALGLEEPNERVLGEVVYLVESPQVLEGRFDERFLQLPERVIVTAMESHQRYFPLGGNRFAFVANGGDPATVVAGNENVLEGRLEDAAFTFERDVRHGIDELAKSLGAITFVAGAGSFAQKRDRLVALVTDLGGGEASQEAARLAKADQAAELVREFPELEGHIGAEYARLAGYPEAVCAAVDEHYLPESAGGPLPETEAGRVLSAADKIDNLTVAFALGQKPSGSRDPYGLRRAAIGLCRLALEGGLSIDLEHLIGRDLGLLRDQGVEAPDVTHDVRDYVLDRLEGVLDVPVEFVRAARATALPGIDQVGELATTLASLDEQTLEELLTVFARTDHIVSKAQEDLGDVEPALLGGWEIALQDALNRSFAELEERSIPKAVDAAVQMGPALEEFFEKVLVMDDDQSIRRNRLALLRDVRNAIVHALGDLSQIPR